MNRLSILSIVTVAIISVAANTASAKASKTAPGLREPAAERYVEAVQLYPYTEGALYRLFTVPGQVSDIMLEPGETIVSLAAGDTARWVVGDTTSGSGTSKRAHILIKPLTPGLSTNLIAATDRRVYRVQLVSRSKNPMIAVRWSYPHSDFITTVSPRDARAADAPVSRGVDVASLHFGYRISGDKPDWRPLRAFDDGRQSWIEFPPSIATSEAPPLFLIDDEGEAALVNYRMTGHFYVVDRIFSVAELRLGGKKQAIVRITRLAPGKRKGR